MATYTTAPLVVATIFQIRRCLWAVGGFCPVGPPSQYNILGSGPNILPKMAFHLTWPGPETAEARVLIHYDMLQTQSMKIDFSKWNCETEKHTLISRFQRSAEENSKICFHFQP